LTFLGREKETVNFEKRLYLDYYCYYYDTAIYKIVPTGTSCVMLTNATLRCYSLFTNTPVSLCLISVATNVLIAEFIQDVVEVRHTAVCVGAFPQLCAEAHGKIIEFVKKWGF